MTEKMTKAMEWKDLVFDQNQRKIQKLTEERSRLIERASDEIKRMSASDNASIYAHRISMLMDEIILKDTQLADAQSYQQELTFLMGEITEAVKSE